MRYVVDVQHAILHSALPAPARHILLTLSIKADWETGIIAPEHTPSLVTLAEMTGLAKSTVTEWLDVLEPAGWLKRERPAHTNGRARTQYTLLIGARGVIAPSRPSRHGGTGKPRTARLQPATDSNPPAAQDVQVTSPPGGPVRQADPNSPPSGTRAVRQADPSSPPGGPASIKNSPSESSPSGDRPPRTPARPRPEPRHASTNTGQGTRLPDDFRPTPQMLAWAQQHAPNVPIDTTTAGFIDYWQAQPGPRGERGDWAATWRYWMRGDQTRWDQRAASCGIPAPTTGRPSPARVDPAEQCPQHRGNRAATCGLCRAERIGAEPTPAPSNTLRATAPPASGRTGQRHQVTAGAPETMAEARYETDPRVRQTTSRERAGEQRSSDGDLRSGAGAAVRS